MLGTGQTESGKGFPSSPEQFTGRAVKAFVAWGVHQTRIIEEILWKFHDPILCEWGNSWIETNTDRDRDDSRKEKTQGDKSVGYSDETGSQGRSGLATTALTIWLGFSCSFPWGKRGEGVTRTSVIVTGLYFYVMENIHFLTQHLYRNKLIWEMDVGFWFVFFFSTGHNFRTIK